jgi:transcription initiation factor TFIID subunit 5
MNDVTCLEFHPNSHYLATASSDSMIKLWGLEDGESMRNFFTVAGAVRSLKFSRAGTHLIAGNDLGQLVIFDVNAGVALDIIETC